MVEKVKINVNEVVPPKQGGTVAEMNIIKHKYHLWKLLLCVGMTTFKLILVLVAKQLTKETISSSRQLDSLAASDAVLLVKHTERISRVALCFREW